MYSPLLLMRIEKVSKKNGEKWVREEDGERLDLDMGGGEAALWAVQHQKKGKDQSNQFSDQGQRHEVHIPCSYLVQIPTFECYMIFKLHFLYSKAGTLWYFFFI